MYLVIAGDAKRAEECAKRLGLPKSHYKTVLNPTQLLEIKKPSAIILTEQHGESDAYMSGPYQMLVSAGVEVLREERLL